MIPEVQAGIAIGVGCVELLAVCSQVIFDFGNLYPQVAREGQCRHSLCSEVHADGADHVGAAVAVVIGARVAADGQDGHGGQVATGQEGRGRGFGFETYGEGKCRRGLKRAGGDCPGGGEFPGSRVVQCRA